MQHSFGKHDLVERENQWLIRPKSGTRVVVPCHQSLHTTLGLTPFDMLSMKFLFGTRNKMFRHYPQAYSEIKMMTLLFFFKNSLQLFFRRECQSSKVASTLCNFCFLIGRQFVRREGSAPKLDCFLCSLEAAPGDRLVLDIPLLQLYQLFAARTSTWNLS